MGVKFLYCLEFTAAVTQWHWNGFKRTVNQQIFIVVQRSYRQPNERKYDMLNEALHLQTA